ncbi:NADH-quinone oxidoreductase subunit N [Rhabdobacter roseus]|uniref:NADH-quinone oxidoreductase subunit N n=1 Tax=Rhabdobacter roseus TaxID=1655419 RepID=A0A840TCX1_9BACT|nr:NADH-quinone oxidoreductase subunit N [Rhabdobacter roseus]MBB5281926.1 NADH-quinone oxidoreductase subunit N [Rhabdobacter roseus]
MYLNEQLSHIRQSLAGLAPELYLVGLFLGFLLAELLLLPRQQDKEKMAGWLQAAALAGAVGLLGLLALQWQEEPAFRFQPLLYLDKKAVLFKVLITVAWLFALVHLRVLRYRFPAEQSTLLIAIVLGLFLLCMATHWLTIYLALELVSLGSYLLVSLSPDRKSAEGGLKYLLFGAVSSAIMLYGISLLYGLTGTLDITDPALRTGLLENSPWVMQVAMLMALGGLFFKLSLVPFHVWTPDVYEAAPTPLVAFLSVAPKAASLLVLMRLVSVLPAEVLSTLGGIALISITVGNVAALWQQNARRLLAYSTIAQAGYLLVGLVAYSQLGFEAATFYVAAYLILNLAAFFLLDLLVPRSDTQLDSYAGLGRQSTLVGAAITVVMVALAGLPPTVGFTAKWLVFSALWDSYEQAGEPWLLWLLIGGLLNAAISLVYYLKVPYLLFFRPAQGTWQPASYWPNQIMAGGLLALIVWLFFQPAGLLHWIGVL